MQHVLNTLSFTCDEQCLYPTLWITIYWIANLKKDWLDAGVIYGCRAHRSLICCSITCNAM